MQRQYTVSGVLVVSILINAFLIGFLFSRVTMPPMLPPFFHHEGLPLQEPGLLHGPGFGHGGPEGPGHTPMDEALSSLPEEEQGKIAALLDEHMKGTHKDMADMHKLFSQLHSLLTAPKFDEKKLSEIEKKIDAQDLKIKQDMSQMMHAIATTLTDEDRIKFFTESMHVAPPEFMHP